MTFLDLARYPFLVALLLAALLFAWWSVDADGR
jgi:hypothetical protein